MSEAQLQVQLREDAGKQQAKALRRAGQIPAVYYTHGQKSVSLSVDAHILKMLLQQDTNILDIIFPDGKAKKTIVRDIQRDPVTDDVLHVDFLGIKLDEKIKMTIPILLTGTPVGVRLDGGILEHLLREVEVEGLPLDIPEHIEIDVTEMKLGDVKTLESIPADKFRFITELTHPLAIVAQAKAPKAMTTEEELVEEGGEEKTEESSSE